MYEKIFCFNIVKKFGLQYGNENKPNHNVMAGLQIMTNILFIPQQDIHDLKDKKCSFVHNLFNSKHFTILVNWNHLLWEKSCTTCCT